MSGSTTKEWQKVKLKNVAKIIMGQSPSSTTYNQEQIGLPFLQGCAEFGSTYPKTKIYCSSPLKIAPQNSILVSVRAPVGEINYSDKDYCIGRGLSSIVPDKSNKDYLYYTLLFSRNSLSKLSQGSTFDAINSNSLYNFEFLLPSSQEQNKIADILTTVDNTIEKTVALIEKYHKIKEGMMQDLFTRGIGEDGKLRPPYEEAPELYKETELGIIPKEWKYNTLNNVSFIVDSLHETPVYSNYGYKMIRVNDIREGPLDTSKALKVTQEVYEKFTKIYKPKKGDILLSRVGSYGISCYINSNEEICLGQNIVVINPKINHMYSYYFLNTNNVKKQIEKATVGSSQRTLSLANIRNILIPLPSSYEQNVIANIILNKEKLIIKEKAVLSKLKLLKQALMQDLLTGKVRVKV